MSFILEGSCAPVICGVRRFLFYHAALCMARGLETMSTTLVEQNKALIRRYVDELNRRRFSVLDELVADKVALGSLHCDPSPPPEVVSREAYQELITGRISAFPDYYVTIQEMIAENDQVVVHWTSRGTQHGEFMGVHSTGKQITGAAISIYRLTDGRIIEVRGIWDRADIWQQLGLIPEDRKIESVGRG